MSEQGTSCCPCHKPRACGTVAMLFIACVVYTHTWLNKPLQGEVKRGGQSGFIMGQLYLGSTVFCPRIIRVVACGSSYFIVTVRPAASMPSASSALGCSQFGTGTVKRVGVGVFRSHHGSSKGLGLDLYSKLAWWPFSIGSRGEREGGQQQGPPSLT